MMTLFFFIQVAFDVDLKCIDDNNHEISDSLERCCEAYEKSYTDYFLCLPFYKSSYKKSILQSLSTLRKFANDCICQRIEAMNAGHEVPSDILGLILQGYSITSDFSMAHLVDEIITFMFGGKVNLVKVHLCYNNYL